MSERITVLSGGKASEKRLCMADEQYLNWYEMYNALPHMHVQRLFASFLKKERRYKRKLGKDNISVMEVMQCFFDAATEIANAQAISKYQSIMTQVESED